MKFQLDNQHMSLSSYNQYADVNLHVEQKKGSTSIIKANKVILALHSPYFDRIFTSIDNMNMFHMGFMGIKETIVRDAIRMIYGETVHVLNQNVGRLSAFLKMLEIDFKKSITGNEEENPPKKFKLTVDEPETEESVDEPVIVESGAIPDQKGSGNEDLQSEEKISLARDSLPSMLPPCPSLPLPTGSADATLYRSVRNTDKTTNSSQLEEKEMSSSSMSSKSGFKYTNKRGDPAFSDNWTETSETELIENLQSVDFKIDPKDTGGHHKNYVCCHCKVVVKALTKARQHFINNHQKCDEELQSIEEALKYKRTAADEVNKLQNNIQDGCNKEMAISQLESIITTLVQHSKKLKNLVVKNLPPNLLRKRDDLIRVMGETVRSIQLYISKLQNIT